MKSEEYTIIREKYFDGRQFIAERVTEEVMETNHFITHIKKAPEIFVQDQKKYP